MNPVHFALLPRDGLFLKNGRGWYASDVGRSHAHAWPLPSTVRGALRAAWGQDLMASSGRRLAPGEWEAKTAKVTLGAALALWRPAGETFTAAHRLWPVPADAVLVDGRVQRLCPRPPPPDVGTLGGEDDEALEALWRPRVPSGKPEPLPLFWTDEALRRWLRGETPEHWCAPEPVRRTDVRVTLNPQSQAAEPGMLYQAEVLETVGPGGGEWALGVQCSLPDPKARFPRGAVGLGGKRRLAVAEPLSHELFDAPKDLEGGARGLRLVLASPAHFARGWLPDGLERGTHGGQPVWMGRLPGMEEPVVLRAALVPRALDLSTWDMARGAPRATRRWVPAGAVYFFERVDGGAFSARTLHSLWLAAWGGGQEEGLGRVLPGHWNPEEVYT